MSDSEKKIYAVQSGLLLRCVPADSVEEAMENAILLAIKDANDAGYGYDESGLGKMMQAVEYQSKHIKFIPTQHIWDRLIERGYIEKHSNTN